MQIEKAMINDPLRVSKLSWKSRIPTICNFAVIYPRNLSFSFLFINKTLRLNNLKTRTAMNAKISVFFFIYVKAIIYMLLCNLHDCTFKVTQCFHLKLVRNISCVFIATRYLVNNKFWLGNYSVYWMSC